MDYNDLTPGDYIDSGLDYFGIGKILDVFRSEHTGSYIINIRFVRQIGLDLRFGGDILISPVPGFENWKKISREEYLVHVGKRRQTLMEMTDQEAA